MKCAFLTLIATITALAMGTAHAASFSCAKAKSRIELAVCGDPELSKMDEVLSISYLKALKTHPLPDYVKARQIDWLSVNEGCDPQNFTSCLKREYQQRLQQLMGTENLMVFANSPTFSYARGDAVVEIWKAGDVWRVGVWGGFVIHELETQEQKHPIFTGCDFNGVAKTLNGETTATSENGDSLAFTIDGDKMTIPDGTKACWGYGQLPVSFARVRR